MLATGIGTYQVLNMSRRPPAPTEKIELESRAGVDGVTAWKTGVRGEPYTIETVVDIDTWADAVALCLLYEALVTTVQTVLYGGVTLPYKVLILNVDATPSKIVRGVGGVSASSTAIVKATWKLQSVWIT